MAAEAAAPVGGGEELDDGDYATRVTHGYMDTFRIL